MRVLEDRGLSCSVSALALHIQTSTSTPFSALLSSESVYGPAPEEIRLFPHRCDSRPWMAVPPKGENPPHHGSDFLCSRPLLGPAYSLLPRQNPFLLRDRAFIDDGPLRHSLSSGVTIEPSSVPLGQTRICQMLLLGVSNPREGAIELPPGPAASISFREEFSDPCHPFRQCRRPSEIVSAGSEGPFISLTLRNEISFRIYTPRSMERL